MLPLRDNIPATRFPIVSLLLIVVNAGVFLWEVSLDPWSLESALLCWGIVPVRYTLPEIAALFTLREQIGALLASMFLHGGWTHLLGNMWTLWIFGDNVEDRLGRARYLLLYAAGGLVAGLLHIFTNLHSPIPTIGASGAVAAVMGAYFRLYPDARVEMVIPPFILGPYFVVPAVIFLGWWFILQFFNGTLSLFSSAGQFGGVAWWAHVGGFVFGALLCSVIRVRRFYRRGYEDFDDPFDW